jgi:muconolactone delta-isomerase
MAAQRKAGARVWRVHGNYLSSDGRSFILIGIITEGTAHQLRARFPSRQWSTS